MSYFDDYGLQLMKVLKIKKKNIRSIRKGFYKHK